MAGRISAQELLDGYDILFSAPLRLAHEAVLTAAAELEPDGWPSIPMVVKWAKCYDVNVAELAALCGILSFRLGNRTIFCDSRRAPAVVRRASPNRFSRKVLAAYGYYATAAAMIERDRAAVH